MVSVVNPSRIKTNGLSKHVRTETDAVGVRLIAYFCASQIPGPWIAPSPVIRELRTLAARREARVAMRTREQNRLSAARESLRKNIELHIKHIETTIANIEKDMCRLIDDNPDLKEKQEQLDSLPDLGKVGTPLTLSFLAGPNLFRTESQAAAFARLDPREHESGASARGQGAPLKSPPCPSAQSTLYAGNGHSFKNQMG